MVFRSTRRKEAARAVSVASPGRKSAIDLLAALERRAIWFAIALVAIGTVRIVSTYNVFSYTFDEPAHIACGMEWLDKGVYTWEPQHPPLARVAAALGPYLMGMRSQNTPRVDIFSMTSEG